jgi:peptidyl-prolyl cis-trans isomerase SurA
LNLQQEGDSEDKNTSKNGGYIGFFGINQLESAFENAAFALEQDGSISEPVETSIGWHIIKRISKKPAVPFEKQRRKLQEEIKNDERYEIAQNSMIQRIKNQAGFVENKAPLDELANMLDEQFYSIKWEVPNDIPNDTLFVIDGEVYMLPAFALFTRQNTRTRLRLSKETPIREALGMLYEEYVNSACINYEEANLEEKYPDFRALMREYEEGILLFEATKLHVWDRASSDTTGLKVFFEKNRDRYMWDERAEIISVNISGVSEKKARKIKSYINKRGIEKAVSKYNRKQTVVTYSRKKAEKRTTRDYEPMAFEKGAESMWSTDGDSNYSYKYIAKIHAPEKKTMDEARGYIIADYQDELEKNWIAQLAEAYPVELNDTVFESLIQE